MKSIRNVLALSLIAVGAAVLAHGNDDHGSKVGAAAHDDHASALGQPGDPKKVDRTVSISMSDAMRFDPASVAVKRNETIRFVLKNEGKLKHEMVLGTPKELKEHAALMIRFPQMQHVDSNQVSVEPGTSGELVWKFTKPGTFDFACLQAGHHDAGMRGKLIVASSATPSKAEGRPSHSH